MSRRGLALLLVLGLTDCRCFGEPRLDAEEVARRAREQRRIARAADAPAWWDKSGWHPPQLVQRDAYFEVCKPLNTEALVNGIVICAVTLGPGDWDFIGDPDPGVDLTFGDEPSWEISGADGTHRGLFSVHGVNLERGDNLRVWAYDRDDVSDHDSAGIADVTFSGSFPIRVSGPKFEAECRVLRHEQAERLLPDEFVPADTLAASLDETMKPMARERDWGYPRREVARIQRSIESAAALVGWRDPRVRERLLRLEKLEARWDELARASVAETVAATPALGTAVKVEGLGIELRLAEVSCDLERKTTLVGTGFADDFQPCFLRLELGRLDGAGAAEGWSALVPFESFTLVEPNGRGHAVELAAIRRGGKRIDDPGKALDGERVEPGGRVELILETERGPAYDDDGNLIATSTLMLTSAAPESRPVLLLLEKDDTRVRLRLQ